MRPCRRGGEGKKIGQSGRTRTRSIPELSRSLTSAPAPQHQHLAPPWVVPPGPECVGEPAGCHPHPAWGGGQGGDSAGLLLSMPQGFQITRHSQEGGVSELAPPAPKDVGAGRCAIRGPPCAGLDRLGSQPSLEPRSGQTCSR